MVREVRQLKLADDEVTALLDLIDAEEAGDRIDVTGRGRERYPYRHWPLDVSVMMELEQVEVHRVATRSLSATGLVFLAAQVFHVDTAARVSLVTIRGSEQTLSGSVSSCRYLHGANGVYEVALRFEHAIDPAVFTAAAIRTRVLVADDSPISLHLAKHLLAAHNATVLLAENGAEAIKTALAHPQDLLLIDDEMPELDGLAAVRELRAQGYLRPIVIMGSGDSDEQRAASLAAGADEFMPKPPTRDLIADLIKRMRPDPLVSTLLHDRGMLPLIDDFVIDLVKRASMIEAAYHARDRELLLHLVREIKGDAGGFGFSEITDLAGEVVNALERGAKLDEQRSQLARLTCFCTSARPASCEGAHRLSAARAGVGGMGVDVALPDAV